ncbi:MAG: hypothetical protein ACFFKA_16580, partial [Candidatus Thorarchaeota archaeon]
FLSHHPDCQKFKGHTLKIGKIKLCIGCFIGYPSALLGIFIIRVTNLHNFVPYECFLWIALPLLLTFILSFTNLTKIKVIKIIQKMLIGLGASFLFWWIWYSPLSNQAKLIQFILTFGIILSILNIYHVYGFLSACYKCETPFSWNKCLGFQKIRNSATLFESMEDYSQKIIRRREQKKKENNYLL